MKRTFVILLAVLLIVSFIPACSAPSQSPGLSEGSSFEAHFIDVGQADATLVLCGNESMLIDGGNADDSNLIYTYLEKHGVTHLDYIVCTHAHEDHVGGLSGALNYATVDTALCPVMEYDSNVFSNFKECLDQQDVRITVPQAGDTFSLGDAHVTVLGPISDTDNANNTSIVLKITYGDTSFLFTGDAERDEEQDILDAGYDLASTVLKVGHHGSDTSTSYQFLLEVMPKYAVIFVGTGNTYGHPHAESLSRLRDASVTVYRTDLQGDILCTSDGETVTFTTSKNQNTDTMPGLGPNSTQVQDNIDFYILNTNTMKFHFPDCASVAQIQEENYQEFSGSRQELLEQDYFSCGNCKP